MIPEKKIIKFKGLLEILKKYQGLKKKKSKKSLYRLYIYSSHKKRSLKIIEYKEKLHLKTLK